MAKACIKRLQALEDDSLVSAIASQPTDVAKQICLYALMKQSRLVWEFMLTVIGEKYRLSAPGSHGIILLLQAHKKCIQIYLTKRRVP